MPRRKLGQIFDSPLRDALPRQIVLNDRSQISHFHDLDSAEIRTIPLQETQSFVS